jgi:hypothetical protein
LGRTESDGSRDELVPGLVLRLEVEMDPVLDRLRLRYGQEQDRRAAVGADDHGLRIVRVVGIVGSVTVAEQLGPEGADPIVIGSGIEGDRPDLDSHAYSWIQERNPPPDVSDRRKRRGCAQ